MTTLPSAASPDSQIITINSVSNEPTMLYGSGRPLPTIPPSLIDLSLQSNPFKILATMVKAQQTAGGYDKNYSPQSPEPSEPSPISTPSGNLSTIEGWKTPHTTTDDNIFYSGDEPSRSPSRRLENWIKKLSLGMSFPRKQECRSTSAKVVDSRSLNRRTYKACRQ